VAPDIVVTAGHCCKEDVNVQDIAFVFGYSVDAAGRTPSTFVSNQVYFGSQLLKRQESDDGDFAVVRLDRAVESTVAKPLSVAAVAPNADAEIILIGYPFGLPCKVADGAKVLDQVPGGRWLRTNCDAYGGNSGSAVVDNNGVVIGILVRGNTDFRIKTNNGVNCFESIRYFDTDGSEILTRCEVFRDAIPGIQ
jgi:V8-like Glu-specific endopeptidase